ncbi:putative hydrolase of the HAD superfamily [Chitinophaga terrae (ex Kim and Jung 2007)]|uniref:Putative hydrolase of the HAD superfamily n=1 Tax=Chitinophaga terrae (ex Kim and Jung 2007) TaxID=408074 RepID=A0A1H4FT54_9BACT|nr:YjjG family noncanonical pyrimidine nucleotidase [Chitinophaga terrae (ex Kim and Jung 2007)]MDQ0105378.1 putative hydrolase of the HAD superfamily [Chitinophaga terrae (ex Kim and Jung 2007)]GEP92858.1 noncanonical pyrimidine nucleotidase, YjjG family protein [Chitinophaga terrae (ex Kim and Jung 2007)]SEB00533.1 putative hydrolase of the HAD superfamily [Chitinophaga terrae (ex Kim and Jung 2007)]
MKYKHLFFDLDHTLWDFEKNEQETLLELYKAHNLEQRGVPTFESFSVSYVAHNERLWERFRKGFITRNDLRDKRFRLTLLDFKIGDEKLTQQLSDSFLEILPYKKALFPEAKETLEYLADKGYPIHMITNGFEETQLLKMRNSGIEHFFTHIITSELAGSLKPYPQIFEFAISRAGTHAMESIMIGDAMELDIKGAHGVGMDQVYFNPAKPPSDFKPTYVINHLKELKAIL